MSRLHRWITPFLLFVLSCGTLSSGGAAQQNCSCPETLNAFVSQARLAAFAPRGRADLLQAVLDNWGLASTAEIKPVLRTQHFLTQIAVETGGLSRIDENLNYTAPRILEVFPRRVTPAQADRLAHNPIALANHVYGGRLGNTQPGDGWRYRGSGFVQITGRANFRDRGRALNLPLEEQPDLVRAPGPGFSAAVAYWQARVINAAADRNQLVEVRRLVNGGTNGLAEARIWFARAKHYFPSTAEAIAQAETPSPSEYTRAAPAASNKEELLAVQERLKELGFLSASTQELIGPTDLSSALKAFQESVGLPATGIYDDDTLYALTLPPPPDPLTPADIEKVEKRLRALGFLKVGPEAVVSPEQISSALRAFQKAQNLPETGIYDEPTFQALESPKAKPEP